MLKRYEFIWTLALLPLLLPGIGCKGVSVTEVSGRTAFGPEYRNFGANNTSDIRYTAIQSLDFKWSNTWTTSVYYQRRDVDDGSGDNENAVLFEVGYPLGQKPKKPEKTALQIEELEKELRELDSILTEAEAGGMSDRFVQAERTISGKSFEKENDNAQP